MVNRPSGLRKWLQAHPAVGRDVDVCIFGRFERWQVCADWVIGEPRALPVGEAQLEAAWQQRLAEARQNGRVLYPGPLCRLERAQVRDSRLWIELGPTDYREFVGTNLSLADVDLAPEERQRFANPLGVSTALTTADGRLLLFRRSRQVAELPRMLHVVGGNVEPSDRRSDGRLDLFLAAEREVAEETGIEADKIEDMACLGLARARRTNKPEIIFAATLRIDSPETSARFARRPGPEHDELILIEATPDAALDFVDRRARTIVPAAKACLVMWAFHSASQPAA